MSHSQFPAALARGGSAAPATARIERLTPRSRALHEEALRYMPGGLSHNARFHAPYPLYFAKARGSRLWDVDGREYIDLWMAHYDAILGHAPREVLDPLREVMADGLHIGLAIEQEVRLAQRVCDLLPSAERVRFCASGTEATMYAVRLARAFTGRATVLKMVGGWHGANTDLMVDVFPPRYGVPEGRGLPPEITRCTRSCTYNDLEDTARAMKETGGDLAAVILEPTLGASGMIPAEQGYLEFLREETRRRGALLIFDEVITGFRFALGGAQAQFGVMPDLTTLGKILGGGLPIGAIAGPAEVLEPSSILRRVPKEERVIIGGGTYSCNPLSMAAGIATLDTLKAREREIYPVLERRNQTLRAGIERAFAARDIPVTITAPSSLHAVHFTRERGLPVRSMADVIGHTFPEQQQELADRLRVHGVFQFHAGALSITHSDADVERLIAAYAQAAEEMAEAER
jgi:glutamate-1-semialdehyde 2,1-aminomutase